MPHDWYEILQVHYTAEPEVIEAAYKRLARKYHPDLNASSDATEMMQRLNDAYAVLSDPERRAAYDRTRREQSRTRPDAETRRRQPSAPEYEAGPRHDRRSPDSQTAPPTPPKTHARTSGVLSGWFGVLFFVALIALAGSETLQQMLDDAWSFVADIVAARPVSRGSASDATRATGPQSSDSENDVGERVRAGNRPPGPPARPRLGASRSNASRIAPSDSATDSSQTPQRPTLTTSERSAAVRLTAPARRTPSPRAPSAAERSIPVTPTAPPTPAGRDPLGGVARRWIQRICETQSVVGGAEAYARCVEDWRRHRPDFGGVSAVERRQIQRICESQAVFSGAEAYVRCVEDWRRHRPDFGGVSAVERRRIQRICESQAAFSGAEAYARCVEDWRRHQPDFGGMSAVERRRIQRICESRSVVNGPAAYAQCVEDWRQHRPDFGGMSAVERRRIQRICESRGVVSGAAAYARCVEDSTTSR